MGQIKKELKLQIKRAVYGIGKVIKVRPSDYSECISICCALQQSGIFTTAGKFSQAGEDPVRIVIEYQRISDYICRNNSNNDFYLSVKPPALLFDIESTASIASTALKNYQAVHFDSHDHIDAEPTIQLLAQLMERFGLEKDPGKEWRYGLSLPSRWKRSLSDARWVIDNNVMPRLIKGEFKAKKLSEEMDPHQGFLTLVDLFAGAVPRITLATHDYELAKEAIVRTKKTGTKVQMELLFGMPCAKMISLSRQHGIPLRFYVPYGDTLFVYGVHHFLINPHKIFRPGFLELFTNGKSKLARIINNV
jgi:proline dehydrogenase